MVRCMFTLRRLCLLIWDGKMRRSIGNPWIEIDPCTSHWSVVSTSQKNLGNFSLLPLQSESHSKRERRRRRAILESYWPSSLSLLSFLAPPLNCSYFYSSVHLNWPPLWQDARTYEWLSSRPLSSPNGDGQIGSHHCDKTGFARKRCHVRHCHTMRLEQYATKIQHVVPMFVAI